MKDKPIVIAYCKNCKYGVKFKRKIFCKFRENKIVMYYGSCLNFERKEDG